MQVGAPCMLMHANIEIVNIILYILFYEYVCLISLALEDELYKQVCMVYECVCLYVCMHVYLTALFGCLRSYWKLVSVRNLIYSHLFRRGMARKPAAPATHTHKLQR